MELRAFAGLSMASAAISIDLILPAFGRVRADLGLAPDSAATAGLVTAFFLGMAFGPIPFGLLADRFGRRWVLLATCALFVGGALAAAAVPSLHWMLWARFAWGLGAAGLRVIAVAAIRDRFAGADMAREMAFAMTIFVLVPVVAPALGAALIEVMPWRGTFVVCAAFGVAIALWSMRLPETLPVDRRQPLHFRQVWVASAAIARSRAALLYTLASVAIFGSFSSYLASSERVIDEVFHRRSWFPFIFGGTAILMGVGSMAVGRTVERIGLGRLIRWSLMAYTAAAVAMYALSRSADGHPSFWPFLILLSLVLVGHNVLFSNLNAAAMMPVGHVAGTAAAVYATVTTAAGAVVGSQLDQAFDGTVNPFSLAFAVAGVVALGMVLALRRPVLGEVR
ncbi:MAG: MFS transporter [Actinomycetota bacterium]|nr:MFS transporter [Actinomycetota bacterium]